MMPTFWELSIRVKRSLFHKASAWASGYPDNMLGVVGQDEDILCFILNSLQYASTQNDL